jgi:hypothetical protein
MLLTEGFDDPGIDCVVILRPTKSRSLYSQMVGRGTRVSPAKSDLLLLDFLWLHEQHNLIRPAHLIASTTEQAQIMQKMIEAGGGKQMALDLEGIATEAQAQREAKLRAELEAKAKRNAKTIDAMEFSLMLHEPDVASYEPTNDYESRPISGGQKKMLENHGIDLGSVTCFGHASKIIDTLIMRSRMDLATPKQVRLMKKWGVEKPEQIKFQDASTIIGRRLGQRAQEKSPGNRHQQRQAREMATV